MDWQYIDIINDLIITLVFIYGVNKGGIGKFYFMYHSNYNQGVFFCKYTETPVGTCR